MGTTQDPIRPSPRGPADYGIWQSIIYPALKVGAVTGPSGVLFGGVAAVVRSSPIPGLFAAAMGLHWFALGSTYWAARSSLLLAMEVKYPTKSFETPRDRILISAVSGSITGATIGSIRGASNIIPGAVMMGLMGLGGQCAYAFADERHTETVRQAEAIEKEGFWTRAFKSQWSPVKKLSEEEYKDMLRERLLGVEAEIALVDDELGKLKKAVDEEDARKGR